MKKLRFKKWVEFILIIIEVIAMIMVACIEINALVCILGGVILTIDIMLLSEYGRLFDYLEDKLGKFIGL